METVIKLDKVSKEYNGINILNNINIDIKKGSTVGIVGGNGSGKSVLFKLICGGVTIGEGSIIGAGSVVTKDIPPGVIAVGNPCKVMRKITEEDKLNLKEDFVIS